MRRFWTFTFTALLLVTLIAGPTDVSVAEKGGKGGKPPKDDPPAEPPVLYEITWLNTLGYPEGNCYDINVNEDGYVIAGRVFDSDDRLNGSGDYGPACIYTESGTVDLNERGARYCIGNLAHLVGRADRVMLAAQDERWHVDR